MSINSLITETHGKNLPTVRLKKAVINDFKSVEHGEIVLNCGRQFVPYGTESDILGIYGQNGSGKTSFIEALAIVGDLLGGSAVDDAYADCIAVGKEYAELEFVFDLQYRNGIIREASYSFCIASRAATSEEITEKYKDAPNKFEIPSNESRVIVFNEKITLDWEESFKKQPIIDTSSEKNAFVPESKRKVIVGIGQNTLLQLKLNKELAYRTSKSFVFMKETLEMFRNHDANSIFYQVLVELRHYAKYYLLVVGTKPSGIIMLNFALPIFTRKGKIMLDLNSPMLMPKHIISEIRGIVKKISDVLGQLVPGLAIDIKTISETMSKEGSPAENTMLVSRRDGKEFPLRDESDGVRKIISILSLIIASFNEQSVTVAIDEFDAGIFEYLLGEILQAMEQSGKGQFIFTSHNLRPLEVINKKFLYFTTTNPQKRYIRLKKIAATNNLRDTFYREIVLNEQEEQIYNRTKRHKIISALKQAGGINNGEKA